MKIKLFSIAFILDVFYACSPQISQPEAPITTEAVLSPELAQG